MDLPCPYCKTKTLESDGLCMTTEMYYEPIVIDNVTHEHDGNHRRGFVTCTKCGSSFHHESIAPCSVQDCDWNKSLLVSGKLTEVPDDKKGKRKTVSQNITPTTKPQVKDQKSYEAWQREAKGKFFALVTYVEDNESMSVLIDIPVAMQKDGLSHNVWKWLSSTLCSDAETTGPGPKWLDGIREDEDSSCLRVVEKPMLSFHPMLMHVRHTFV
jgi:hypothetical protein